MVSTLLQSIPQTLYRLWVKSQVQSRLGQFLSLFLCLNLLVWTFASPAQAVTNIKLTKLSYSECTGELAEGVVISGGPTALPATCFLIQGTAYNPTNKTVYDADVFGRVLDATGNPVFQNRGRVGSIEEVPPGTSSFEVRISVPVGNVEPLKLLNFKASGFSSSVKFQYKPIR